MTRISVNSFRWVPSLDVVTNIKQGDSVYISQQSIADQSVLLAYVNITLWHGGASSSSSLWWSDIQWTTVEQALLVTKYLNSLRTTDVIAVQQKATDVSNVNTIIQQGSALIAKGNALIAPLTAIVDEQSSIISTCTSQKQQADDLYNESLQQYNGISVEKATQQAQQASSCISQASVAMNSAKWVLSNLESELKKTQNYVSLLIANTSLLKQYAGVLDTDIPAQLVQLKKDLANL